MRRTAVAALVCAAFVGLTAAVGSADTAAGYAGPGEWFSPGEGHGSPYDHLCGRWIENRFPKPSSAWGLITFIDPSGGWNSSKQGYGALDRALPSPNWTKKLHCKNNSGSTYQGGCWGVVRHYPCA